MPEYITDPALIRSLAESRELEHDAFRTFIKNRDAAQTDALVQELNAQVSPHIDCTRCGSCCKSLMINVTAGEVTGLANYLNLPEKTVKEKYIEESLQGQMIMNRIPCHFLSGTRCSIYEQRFTECREFPHLHKDNFSGRMFGLLFHYAHCPIIFNVIEAVKIKTGFKNSGKT